MRLQFAASVVAGLLGGALVALGASRPWHGDDLEMVNAADASTTLSGSFAAVMLLGAVVVAVTRNVGRRIAGVLVAATGVIAAYVGITVGGDWPFARVLVVVGALLAVASGALATARGQRWPSMSQRYDAPSARDDSQETDPWRMLDRGEDPTV